MSDMEVILEHPIKNLIIPECVLVEELIYYDGPLLSLHECNGDKALIVWLDCNDENNRWAILKISEQCLSDFRSNVITLLEVYKQVSEIIVYDDDNISKTVVLITDFAGMPKEYLPSEGSYLQPHQS